LLKKNAELRMPLADVAKHPWIKANMEPRTTEVKPESSGKKPTMAGRH